MSSENLKKTQYIPKLYSLGVSKFSIISFPGKYRLLKFEERSRKEVCKGDLIL